MKLLRVKFKKISLSQKIILSMAGMVLLTVAASSLLFYFVFNQKVDNFTQELDRARQVAQQSGGQKIVTDADILTNIKAVVNTTTSTPQETLDKVRGALNVNRDVNYSVIRNALQQSGLSERPVGEQFGVKPPHGSAFLGAPNGNQLLSNIIFSPVADSVWVGVGLAAVLAIVLGWLLARGIVKPLRQLEQASEQVAGGNYKLHIKQSGDSDLARLATSFNRMAKTLSLTEQKRKDLLSDISHEFRTPLSSIQGYTEVLSDGLVTEPTHQHEIYDHILKEVKHLNTMVNSMRAWVNNEQALESLSLVETSVSAIGEEVVKRFQPTAHQKNIRLELDVASPEPLVRTDSEAVIHVLSNLVDNALRYTGEAGEVAVKIGYAPSNSAFAEKQVKSGKGRRVWFEVSDSGIGIAAEHLPFVFERFYRVDKSRSRNTGGTGLGLAIVRDTVQTLGGEVKISSEPGIGTIIGFWLPAATVSQPTRHLLPMFSNAQVT